jgi:hypothetical protein
MCRPVWQEAAVSRKRRKKIESREITGLKYFDKLAPLLDRLHDDACARDRAGNRELHYDQYCLLILLYLFNPVVTSLRGLQQASELAKVQKKLGCPRAALGSFSEAATVFDPERLKEIIAELGAELTPLARDPRLRDVPGAITGVDGTILAALPKLMQASVQKRATGSGLVKWRLHTHFEVDRYVPTRIDVTPHGGGPHDERACSNEPSNPTAPTSWTAAMPSLRSSTGSSPPGAATSAACATTASRRWSRSGN